MGADDDDDCNASFETLHSVHSEYPVGHPFHQSAVHACDAKTAERLASQAKFEPTPERHRFVLLTYLALACATAAPIVAMFAFLELPEERLVARSYGADVLLCLCGLALLWGMLGGNRLRVRPRLSAALMVIFVADESLHGGFLYYDNEPLYKTMMCVLFQSELTYLSAALFCLQTRLDIARGRYLSACIVGAILLVLNALLLSSLVLVFRWIPAWNVLYSSIGSLFIVVFLVYYTSTFLCGDQRVDPDQFVYASAKTICFIFVYFSVIGQGFKLNAVFQRM